MNAVDKKRLAKEAEMQTNALKTITHWRNIALAISSTGAVLTYVGIAVQHNLFLSIFGIILMALCFISAIILNLGLKNGRRNVEKMLAILEERHEI